MYLKVCRYIYMDANILTKGAGINDEPEEMNSSPDLRSSPNACRRLGWLVPVAAAARAFAVATVAPFASNGHIALASCIVNKPFIITILSTSSTVWSVNSVGAAVETPTLLTSSRNPPFACRATAAATDATAPVTSAATSTPTATA